MDQKRGLEAQLTGRAPEHTHAPKTLANAISAPTGVLHLYLSGGYFRVLGALKTLESRTFREDSCWIPRPTGIPDSAIARCALAVHATFRNTTSEVLGPPPSVQVAFSQGELMLSEILVLRRLYVRSLCRRFVVLGLGSLALISLAPPNAAAQSCSITPSFQAVKAGDCVQFSAEGCSDWSLNGVGTLDQSGRYCAPPTVFVQNYSKGSQILPNSFGDPTLTLAIFPYIRTVGGSRASQPLEGRVRSTTSSSEEVHATTRPSTRTCATRTRRCR